MTDNGENRPLSVTVNNKRTCYVYGADGARLKKVENLAANTDCTALPPTANATTYFGGVEVRNWLVPGQEVVLTYPHPAIKLTNGVASFLHRDHLGSVRAITNATGAKVESAVYKPFGAQTEFVQPGLTTPESKGWIGERYDADAGLQYLNARYYDPVLGMFLQPDWWEVLQPGVGTNRFSYSFNDPVNLSDPNGNCVWDACITEATLTYALGAAIVAYIITDTADNGVPDGSLLITTIENFDVGQEGFTPTPSEPTVLSSPIDEGPSITVEGMSSEVESGPIVLADPIQDDFFGNTVYAGQTGSYEIYVNDPEGKQFVYVGKGPEERMRASMRRLDGQGFEVIDKLWEAAPSPREAFKDEDRRIESLSGGDGVGSGYLLNERNSPGKRYREEDDD